MSIVFFLPYSVSINDAKSRLMELEDQFSRFPLSVNDVDDVTFVKDSNTSLRETVTTLPRSSTLVLYSIDQINMPMSDFNETLVRRRHENLTVKILTPYLELNPKEFDSAQILEAMAMSQKPRRFLKYNDDSVGYKKIAKEVISKMRIDRSNGLSYREIASKNGVSVHSAFSKTKDVNPLKKVVYKKPHKREPDFNLEKLKTIELDYDGKLFRVIERFIKSQRTANTKESYYIDIKRFFRYCAAEEIAIETLDDLNRVELGADYLSYLKNKGYKNTSRRKFFMVINSLLTYAEKLLYIDVNQLKMVNLPKVSRQKVETAPLTTEEIKLMTSKARELFEEEKEFNKKMIAHRNYIGISLLISTGMRVGSLRNLKKKHIKTKLGYTILDLYSKGKAYEFKLKKNMARQLDIYLNTYFSNDEQGECYIFFKDDPFNYESLTTSGIDKMLARLSKRVKIKEKVTSHTFRASFALHQYESGKSVIDIQMMLNHSDPNQTIAYIKPFLQPDEENWLDDVI